MRRYWINKSQISNDQVSFTNEQFHHIFSVCRQVVGQHFEVITEDGKAFLVEVVSVEKKQAFAKIIETRMIQKLKTPHLHIALSISRFNVMDSLIERCVEMGVSSFTPFYSDFSFIRKAANLPEGKIERWQKIIVSATQQCGRGELMQLNAALGLKDLIDQINPTDQKWCLFAYEGIGLLSIQQFIQTKKTGPLPQPKDIWLIIGSEGGFSNDEAGWLQQLGLDPVTLGAQILRVETACLTLVSVLKYEFGLLS